MTNDDSGYTQMVDTDRQIDRQIHRLDRFDTQMIARLGRINRLDRQMIDQIGQIDRLDRQIHRWMILQEQIMQMNRLL